MSFSSYFLEGFFLVGGVIHPILFKATSTRPASIVAPVALREEKQVHAPLLSPLGLDTGACRPSPPPQMDNRRQANLFVPATS